MHKSRGGLAPSAESTAPRPQIKILWQIVATDPAFLDLCSACNYMVTTTFSALWFDRVSQLELRMIINLTIDQVVFR